MDFACFIIGAILITIGLVFEIISVIGIYKFDYVIKRLHAAAIGDTGALMLVVLGLVIMNGANLFSVKLLFVILFLWLGSAVASHYIVLMILSTDTEKAEKYVDYIDVKGDEL